MGLITNFASGELSPNLFGRIDLPQYHSGAARLENWDVIPTGGIKRRSGMEYLAAIAVTEKSRLIPIIISRSEKYLLLFAHEKIDVYKAGGKSPIKTFSNTDVNPERLYAGNEINEINFAQDFNTLVFVHKNHQPIELKINGGYPIIHILQFDFDVPVVADKDITEKEKAEYEGVKDKYYKNNGWLTSAGNYPTAVCFFNGRLVLAGTKDNPQRIFASSPIKEADKPYNFATYKKFLTPKREYSTLFGKINVNNTSIITTTEKYVVDSFKKPPEEYYVDSQLYPPYPYTRIREINLKQIQLTTGTKSGIVVLNIVSILNELVAKQTAYDNNNNSDYEFPLLYRRWKSTYFDDARDVTYPQEYECSLKAIVRAQSIVTYFFERIYNMGTNVGPGSGWTTTSSGTEPSILTNIKDGELEDYILNPLTFNNNIIDKINNKITSIMSSDWYKGISEYVRNHMTTKDEVLYPENKTAIINKLYENIHSTCFYELNTGPVNGIEPYYDTPSNLSSRISARIVGTDETYIAVFTQEIIVDEYPTPDCGFTFELASGKNDAIKWLSVNRGIIIGTELSEYVMPPDVHATTPPYVVALSKYGSDNIPGEAVGAATCFFQSGRKGLVEYYPNEYDQFRANNMALLAQHILHESAAKEFDFATAPYTRLYVTREDGALVTLLYERNTGTFAWNRITTGEVTRNMITPEEVERARKIKESHRGDNPYRYDHSPFEPPVKMERFVEGKILTCAVLPGDDGFDDAYLIVKRGSKFFLERLREAGTVYLDSWREWKWANELDKRLLLDSYTPDAVVYDENEVKVYELSAPTGQLPPSSEEGSRRYIGYPYKSVFKSMPVVGNERMEPVNMSAMCVRLLDSYMPQIWNREWVKSEPDKTVHNGVIKHTNVLSGQSRTTQFHITHDAPNRCRVLSVYTEV